MLFFSAWKWSLMWSRRRRSSSLWCARRSSSIDGEPLFGLDSSCKGNHVILQKVSAPCLLPSIGKVRVPGKQRTRSCESHFSLAEFGALKFADKDRLEETARWRIMTVSTVGVVRTQSKLIRRRVGSFKTKKTDKRCSLGGGAIDLMHFDPSSRGGWGPKG